MNILRVRPLVHAVRTARTYSAARFVPPQSMDDVDPDDQIGVDLRPAPDTRTFYTARADFHEACGVLEEASKVSERALRSVNLLPLPPAARALLPPIRTAWLRREGIAAALGAKLMTTAHHRRVHTVLMRLFDMRRIAVAGQEQEIAAHLDSLLELFERGDKDAHLARGKRRPAPLDEYGRTYTFGKRKESTARVWMIATRPAQGKLPTTTVLVNNRPLAAYFPNMMDRQRVLRPFKLTGLIGAFNVFGLVRGGGTTGQAGALAHGIAKAIVSHVPDVEIILRRAKLLRRDPRMVERKKTGLAKARKRYTWVKR